MYGVVDRFVQSLGKIYVLLHRVSRFPAVYVTLTTLDQSYCHNEPASDSNSTTSLWILFDATCSILPKRVAGG